MRFVPSLMFVVACAPAEPVAPQAVSLSFAARVGDADAACGQSYDDLGSTGASAVLKDFRLYVHDVALVTADGVRLPVTLDETAWQHEGTALLDFEDGTDACSEFGTPQTNTVLTGEADAGEIAGVSFAIGVPFDQNHLDPATAVAPLDVASMFWAWKGGHKYLRAELSVDGTTPWNIHTGSGGCESAAATMAPDAPCSHPNVAQVDLVSSADDTIVFDLAALLADVDLSDNAAESPPGCMISPADGAECIDMFPALGMDYATGECVDGCAEQVFAYAE